MSRVVLRGMAIAMLVVANLAPAVVSANAVQPHGSGVNDLSITGQPAPNIGFYYGGPPMVVGCTSATCFTPSEPVSIYLGSPLTGTLMLATTALSGGTLHASVPVPQVNPGTYMVTAVGQRSHFSHTGTVTIVPVLRPGVTQGAAGTELALTGAGFLPNEQVTIYFNWQNAQSPGQIAATTLADTSGAFAWAGMVVTDTPGTYKIAGVGAASGAFTYFTFTIVPSLSVTPFVGTPGQTLTVSGAGFKASAPLGVYFGGVTTRIATTTTDASGAFAMYTATVPSGQAPRATAYAVYGAVYTKSGAQQPYGTAWFTVVAPSTPSLAIASQAATAGGAPGGPLVVAGAGWSAMTRWPSIGAPARPSPPPCW